MQINSLIGARRPLSKVPASVYSVLKLQPSCGLVWFSNLANLN